MSAVTTYIIILWIGATIHKIVTTYDVSVYRCSPKIGDKIHMIQINTAIQHSDNDVRAALLYFPCFDRINVCIVSTTILTGIMQCPLLGKTRIKRCGLRSTSDKILLRI